MNEIEAVAPRVRLTFRDGRWHVYHLWGIGWHEYDAYRSEKRARRVARRLAREDFKTDQRIGAKHAEDAEIRRILQEPE